MTIRSNCKLTEKDVLQIKQLCNTGRNSQRSLAKEFRVSQTTIVRILRGITYKKIYHELS